MKVKYLSGDDHARWDEYVTSSKFSSIFHLSGWKVVYEATLGLETHYLYLEEGSSIAGVLPLFALNGRVFGKTVTSVPGGLLASTQEAADHLADFARKILERKKARYLLIRDGHQNWKLPGFERNLDHCTYIAEVPATVEQIWSSMNRDTRRQTKQAIRKGVTTFNGNVMLDDFYPVYLQAMRTRGTPPFGINFFQKVLSTFPQNFVLELVSANEEIISGGFMSPFRDTVFCTWAGILIEHYRLRPSHLLFWSTLKFAFENGYKWVDFGRSQQGSGSHKFKLNWGAQPRQLIQHYYLNGNSEPPKVGSQLAEDSNYRILVNLWKRLPLSLTALIGPQIRRSLPFG